MTTPVNLPRLVVQRIFFVDTEASMRAHIRKWGNSLAIRIPRTFASEANLADGTPVELSLADGKLVAAPVRKAAATLRRLVARVRPEQLHGETEWSGPSGQESW
jgi:antitoxin MazE